MIAKYRRLYPYAPYLNEEIGFEKSIPDESTEEEMIEAIVQLKEISDKAHKKLNPLLYSDGKEVKHDWSTAETSSENLHERFVRETILDIQGCTQMSFINGRGVEEGLISYQDATKKDPRINEAYDKKYHELYI